MNHFQVSTDESLSSVRRHSGEELCDRNAQSFGDPVEAFDAGQNAGVLDLVQTRLGDVGSVGELRLGEPVRNAQLADLTADLFSNG